MFQRDSSISEFRVQLEVNKIAYFRLTKYTYFRHTLNFTQGQCMPQFDKYIVLYFANWIKKTVVFSICKLDVKYLQSVKGTENYIQITYFWILIVSQKHISSYIQIDNLKHVIHVKIIIYLTRLMLPLKDDTTFYHYLNFLNTFHLVLAILYY